MKALAQWARSFAKGAQWRYLLVFVVVMLLPTALAFFPYRSFFGTLFDTSTREASLVAWLDSHALIEVVRQLGEPSAGIVFHGSHAAFFVALLVAPFLAGAAATIAREEGKALRVREILADAAELYPRMLRMALVSVLPLGIAAGGIALAFHLAGNVGDKATAEATSDRAYRIATLASLLLWWLFAITADAGRAYLAADSQRKSALVAWWAGVKLTVRRPLRVMGLSLLTSIVGVGGALALTATRTRLTQAGTGMILAAIVLGQVAVAVLAWGRGARIAGLVELIRESED
jgi:hypothetical protein